MECAVTGWFTVVEAQFLLKRIKKTNSKFLHVLSSLPADLVIKLLSTLHANSNYEELKAAVIATYEQTKPELFTKFMSDIKMTGRPSYFLQELMATASKIGVSEDLVRHYKHSNNNSNYSVTNVVRPFHNNQCPRVCHWHV